MRCTLVAAGWRAAMVALAASAARAAAVAKQGAVGAAASLVGSLVAAVAKEAVGDGRAVLVARAGLKVERAVSAARAARG